jgi:hypothetical protein
MKLGIIVPNHVSGDAIQYACLPENFFLNVGHKLIDVSSSFIFDHNPYVIRDEEPEQVINLWFHSFKPSHEFLSKSERWCEGFNLKMFLRHPRLYIYEDIARPLNPPLVSVHCSGKTRGHLSDKVVEVIAEKYKDCDIIQVGGLQDRETPFIDRRGLSFFESAKVIASSQVFIGLDSAMYHVARCYPNVRRKIIIQNSHYNEEQLQKFHPYRCPELDSYDWIDFDTEYFNEFDHDIGITNALHKI